MPTEPKTRLLRFVNRAHSAAVVSLALYAPPPMTDDPLEIDAPTLAGVIAKLDRADVLAAALLEDIEDFLDGCPYRIASQVDPATGECVLRAEVVTEPPVLDWGPRIGDVLFNFRSALDQLAWQLALVNRPGQEPPTRTEFPIFKDAEEFNRNREAKIGGLSTEAQERIYALQPFSAERAVRPEGDNLWLLHELNRTDKHRTLHLVGAILQTVSMDGGAMVELGLDLGAFAAVHTFKDGDEIHRWTSPLPCDEANRKLTFNYGIAFDAEGPGNPVKLPLRGAIESWRRIIREDAVDSFEEFFPA